ncbi:MAG: hypothetical protein GX577_06505 [Leptolinea sp.]|nr:hypothetical protein [Leptolinea sp.]
MEQLAGFVSWFAGLWMLIKLFQKKGILHGILGLFSFNLYPFIWGLIHFKEADIKKPMTIWLIAIAVGLILGFFSIFSSLSGGEESLLFLFV